MEDEFTNRLRSHAHRLNGIDTSGYMEGQESQKSGKSWCLETCGCLLPSIPRAERGWFHFCPNSPSTVLWGTCPPVSSKEKRLSLPSCHFLFQSITPHGCYPGNISPVPTVTTSSRHLSHLGQHSALLCSSFGTSPMYHLSVPYTGARGMVRNNPATLLLETLQGLCLVHKFKTKLCTVGDTRTLRM
jgi:hypothetical protein